MIDPSTHAQAIGTFLRAYREQHGLTLDAIAKAGRSFGASWGTASIRNFEAGKGTDRLPTLLTLGLALNHLTGDDLTVNDLLGSTEAMSPPVRNGLPPTRDWLSGVLSGEPVILRKPEDLVGGHKRFAETVRDASAQLTRLTKEMPSDLDFADLERIDLESETLAEQRAAAKLGILPKAIKAWSVSLWGQSLEEEAAARARAKATDTDKPVTAQARGAMTKHLLHEIRLELEAQRRETDHGEHPAAP